MVTLIRGSILDFEGDAIINPANSHLQHAGGLARVVADAACDVVGEPGWRYFRSVAEADRWQQEQLDHAPIPTGGCGVTSAGALPYKAILHAVGPIWGGGGYQEDKLLWRCHLSVLETANRMGFDSIAMPAISCGIFGYPVERAAPIAIEAALGFSRPDVTFYLPDEGHIEAFDNALTAGVAYQCSQ